MNLKQIPVAQALFRQWVKARGNKRNQASRDFIRSWYQIENDPIYSEVTESENIRDLRDLEVGGWLKIVPERYYSDRVAKVRIPLKVEAKWKEAFDFVESDDSEIQKIADYDWSSKLIFLKTTRISVPFSDLRQLDEYLRSRRNGDKSFPIKERSISIFGDEKRLDELHRGSLLFREGCLCLEDFDCYLVAEPLAWLRGRNPEGPVIVLENAATFETYRCWDQIQARYSAIVYGGGNRFYDSARRMGEVFQELGGVRKTVYFGDLDAAGLRIARMASKVFIEMGFPPLVPDFFSYSKLIEVVLNEPKLRTWKGLSRATDKDLSWLGRLGSQAQKLIVNHGRIAQEWLNIERLLDDYVGMKNTN